MRYTLRQIEYFIATAETGSITLASERVNISQPSISTAIAHLEEELGTQLFIRRHAQGLSLTPAGRAVLAEAKRLVFALAFGPCGLERLCAYADVRHARSQRALEGVGFTREGTLREHHRHGDVRKDVAFYGLLRSEWAAAAPAPVTISGDVPAAFRVTGEPEPAAASSRSLLADRSDSIPVIAASASIRLSAASKTCSLSSCMSLE